MYIYTPPKDEIFVGLKDVDLTDLCSFVPGSNQKDKFNSFYGKKHTLETKKLISKKLTGTRHPYSPKPWAKDNLKFIKYRAYGHYEITEPDGNKIIVIDLKSYCKEKNISYTSMASLSNGKYPKNKYKGYQSKKLGYIKIHQ